MNLFRIFILSVLGTSTCSVMANALELCVVDLMGANGDTMAVAKDYALVAKQWNVDIKLKVYTKNNLALADFEQKKCEGIVADSFVTKKYNLY